MADYTLLIGGVDYTAYLISKSLSLKLNSFVFALLDPQPVFNNQTGLDKSVSFTWPGRGVAWTGTVVWGSVSATSGAGGTAIVTIAATNTTAAVTEQAPFDLNSVPANTTTLFELEDGSGHILLESGTTTGPGSYLTEGTLRYSFQGLTYSQRRNSDATLTLIVECTVFQPGLWPGQYLVFTADIGDVPVAIGTLTIRRLTVTWPVEQPFYQIEAGDPLVPVTVAGVA